MLWSWGLLLLFLSTAAADLRVADLKSGDNFTIECSSTDCIDSLDGISGVYLYRDNEQITYYAKSDGKVYPQNPQDNGRIAGTGSLEKHRITISNVTVGDSGLYHCSYYNFNEGKCHVKCNWIYVVISDGENTPTPAIPKDTSPSPILIIILTATVSILTTMVFTLVIIPKVKDCFKEQGDGCSRSNEVYEVMTSNGFRSVSGMHA